MTTMPYVALHARPTRAVDVSEEVVSRRVYRWQPRMTICMKTCYHGLKRLLYEGPPHAMPTHEWP